MKKLMLAGLTAFFLASYARGEMPRQFQNKIDEKKEIIEVVQASDTPYASLEKYVRELEKEISDKKNYISSLEKTLQEKEKQLKETTDAKSALETKLSAQKTEIDKKYASEIEDLKKELSEKKRDLQEITQIKSAIEKEDTFQRKKIAKLEKNLEEKEEEIMKTKEAKKNYIAKLEKSLQEKEKQLKKEEKTFAEKGKREITPLTAEEIEVVTMKEKYEVGKPTQAASIQSTLLTPEEIDAIREPGVKPKKPTAEPKELEKKLALGLGIAHGDNMYLPSVSVSYKKINAGLIYGEGSEEMPTVTTRVEGTKYNAVGMKNESIEKSVFGASISTLLGEIAKGWNAEAGVALFRYTTTTNTKIEEKIESKNGNLLSRNTDSYSRTEKENKGKLYLGVSKKIKNLELRLGSFLGEKPYYSLGITYKPKH